METALAGQGAITPDGTDPKAYLNYIFLDKNFDPDVENENNNDIGFERLPSGALNNYQIVGKRNIDRPGKKFCLFLQQFNYYFPKV